jgi:hypothetical protein
MEWNKLVYLEDRPVRKLDRITAEAWAEGGFELEQQRKNEFLIEEHKINTSFVQRNIVLQEEYKKYREQKIANIKMETKAVKDKLIEKQRSLRDMIRRARPNTEEYEDLQSKLVNVDQELKNDMFEIINEDDIVVPPIRRVADQPGQPGYRQRQEELRREEREREAWERERQQRIERERVDMPKADSIIPIPRQEAPKVKSRAERIKEEGCVMSTDSESENDPTMMAK